MLVRMPQTGSASPKLRPALLLSVLPGPYQNLLLCGISTQFHEQQPNWDESMRPGDADFKRSGLHQTSIIRLSYLYASEQSEIAGAIGRIDADRLERLRARLAENLRT